MQINSKINITRKPRRLCYLFVVALAVIFVILIQFEAYKFVLQKPNDNSEGSSSLRERLLKNHSDYVVENLPG